MNYNKNVYNYGKNNIKYNSSVSKRVFEEYLEMYPKDYFAYIYYSKVLINLGYFNDALKVLKCVKEKALIVINLITILKYLTILCKKLIIIH